MNRSNKKKILRRYVLYISEEITVPYLNIETGNRHLNIGGWYVFAPKYGVKIQFSPQILQIMSSIFSQSDKMDFEVFNALKILP